MTHQLGDMKYHGIVKVVEESAELIAELAKLTACPDGIFWDGSNIHERVLDEIGDALAAINFFVGQLPNPADQLAINKRCMEKTVKFMMWHDAGQMAGIFVPSQQVREEDDTGPPTTA